MEKETEQVILLLMLLVIAMFEALKILSSLLEKGVLKDKRMLLMKKTNAELRSMLPDIKKSYRLTKKELVEMILC
jgi:hypothetical protein